jgi:hypothetical protein
VRVGLSTAPPAVASEHQHIDFAGLLGRDHG